MVVAREFLGAWGGDCEGLGLIIGVAVMRIYVSEVGFLDRIHLDFYVYRREEDCLRGYLYPGGS